MHQVWNCPVTSSHCLETPHSHTAHICESQCVNLSHSRAEKENVEVLKWQQQCVLSVNTLFCALLFVPLKDETEVTGRPTVKRNTNIYAFHIAFTQGSPQNNFLGVNSWITIFVKTIFIAHNLSSNTWYCSALMLLQDSLIEMDLCFRLLFYVTRWW